jgi:hypothetical protein
MKSIPREQGGLNEQRPEISVAALGDFAELGAIAGRLLLG